MNELALFAGAGGGILGGHILGWRTVCAVEFEPYAACVLVARQNDGLLPPFPVWDDVRTFDGRPWRGRVDVVSGGFPCQDISLAGSGAGIDGARSGLWSHMARIVGEVRPRHVYVENSPALLTRGLGRVLGDLAALGYDCRWTVLGAADVGAPHQRDRLWLVANAATQRCAGSRHERDSAGRPVPVGGGEAMADPDCEGQLQQGRPECQERRRSGHSGEAVAHPNGQRLAIGPDQRSDGSKEQPAAARGGAMAHAEHSGCEGRHPHCWHFGTGAAMPPDRRRPEPGLGGGLDGMAARLVSPWADGWEDGIPRVAETAPARVDRLTAIGNGQVPLCHATAWRLLTQPHGDMT